MAGRDSICTIGIGPKRTVTRSCAPVEDAVPAKVLSAKDCPCSRTFPQGARSGAA